MYDYDSTGTLDPNGKLSVLSGRTALGRAIDNWIYTSISERIMYPEEGGNLIYYLGKPMHEDMLGELREKIQAGLENDFGTNIVVHSVTVKDIPNEETIAITTVVTVAGNTIANETILEG